MSEVEFKTVQENTDRYLAEKFERERDKYKAMLFDAWNNLRGQSKGMKRMARRITNLQAQIDALMFEHSPKKLSVDQLKRLYKRKHG